MRLAALAVLAAAPVLAILAPGCSSSSPPSEPVDVTFQEQGPRNSALLGEFVAVVDRASHTMSIHPVGAPITLGHDLRPLSQDPILDDQGGGGTCSSSIDAGTGSTSSQACNTIDLVSSNCVDTFSTTGASTNAFQCDVTLRSYYATRGLPNVYAQITSIQLSHAAISGYAATNSDTDTTYSPALANNLGLWSYNNGSTHGSFLSPGSASGNGTICSSGSSGACSGATKTWKFANNADQNITYGIQVWASLGFSKYTMAAATTSYQAICSGAGGSGTSANGHSLQVQRISLPFDFPIYGNDYNGSTTALAQTVSATGAAGAQIVFGGTALSATTTAIQLPSTSAPEPSFYPFWDYLANNSPGHGPPTSDVCYVTIGSAPNRLFGIEWYNMDFSSTTPPGAGSSDTGAALDFEAFLYEGTGRIDTVYHSMVGSGKSGATANRQNGSLASVGIQNQTGTVATADYQEASHTYGTGTAYSWIPTP
jgi:hypothetical protein